MCSGPLQNLVIGDFGIVFEARLLTQCSCRNAVSTYLPLVAERIAEAGI